jgi:hypothetical protein
VIAVRAGLHTIGALLALDHHLDALGGRRPHAEAHPSSGGLGAAIAAPDLGECICKL